MNPRDPCWVGFCLPSLPLAMSALIAAPIAVLHLGHSLKPVPGKDICGVGLGGNSASEHLTFDVCVFILAYCIPVILVFFLAFGLIFR